MKKPVFPQISSFSSLRNLFSLQTVWTIISIFNGLFQQYGNLRNYYYKNVF